MSRQTVLDDSMRERQERENSITQMIAGNQKTLDKYLQDKEIGIRLMMEASSARFHLVEYPNSSSLHPKFAKFYRDNRETLLQIVSDVDEIVAAAKLWECKCWFGGTQVPLTLEQLEQKNWQAVEDCRSDKKRNPPTAGLQKLYHDSPSRGHKGVHDDFIVMMWGSAGRVMITIQDSKPVNEGGKFNGAWISIVFDEDADYPRGGLQGQCGTKEELLGLLKASSESLPELKPNDNISMI